MARSHPIGGLISLASSLAVVCVLAGGRSAEAQTDGASVFTAVEGPGTLDPGCDSTFASGRTNETTTVSCDGGSLAPIVQIDLSAEANAPIVTGDLPELHASSRMQVDTSGGTNLVGGRYYGYAAARFREYIRFGSVRPASMVITFHLTGVIDAHSAVISALGSSKAAGGVLVDVADVFYTPSFVGSFIPFARGAAATTSTLLGDVLTTDRFLYPNNHPDFGFADDGAGNFELTLGPAFFTNPQNTHLSLELGLDTVAEVYTLWVVPSPVIDATADFGHTFTMTSLQAFDDQGADITADAVAGFESDAFPLPEPSAASLVGAGIGMTAWLGTRRIRIRSAVRPSMPVVA